jgi:large subunit ribosomal protein L6
MSNIGRKKLYIPDGVNIRIEDKSIIISGKLGKIKETRLIDIEYIQEKNNIQLISKNSRLHGITRSILNNHIIGVSQGFKKSLKIVGVGYRVQLQKKKLVFKIGFSHDITYTLPESISAISPKPDHLVLFGIKKDFLNQIVAEIQNLRKPDPYKGKGIQIEGQTLNLKEGKKK